MDRYDERKSDSESIERSSSNTADERNGDVLGLGHGPVPKKPGDPHASNDPEAVAHRRQRLHDSEDAGVSNPDSEHGAGATGVDMGAGGGGTDVSGS